MSWWNRVRDGPKPEEVKALGPVEADCTEKPDLSRSDLPHPEGAISGDPYEDPPHQNKRV